MKKEIKNQNINIVKFCLEGLLSPIGFYRIGKEASKPDIWLPEDKFMRNYEKYAVPVMLAVADVGKYVTYTHLLGLIFLTNHQ